MCWVGQFLEAGQKLRVYSIDLVDTASFGGCKCSALEHKHSNPPGCESLISKGFEYHSLALLTFHCFTRTQFKGSSTIKHISWSVKWFVRQKHNQQLNLFKNHLLVDPWVILTMLSYKPHASAYRSYSSANWRCASCCMLLSPLIQSLQLSECLSQQPRRPIPR